MHRNFFADTVSIWAAKKGGNTMFEQEALASDFAAKRLWSTCVGLTGEALLLACAALAPLVSPQALPHSRAIMAWLLPATPPPPPPAAGNAAKARPERPPVERLQSVPGRLVAPATIPQKAAVIIDEPLGSPEYGVPGGSYLGERNGVPGGMLKSILDAVPAPAVEAAPVAAAKPIPMAPKQVTVGGRVEMARLIHRVEPLYPPLARQMHVSGVVELVGIIAINGRIRELKLMNGNPLLAPSALDAVRQWVYEPTLLNGEPVELVATISVTFHLN
jgi:protein TonB